MGQQAREHGHTRGISWHGIVVAAGIVAACVLMLALRLRQSHTSLVFDEYASMYFSDQSFRNLWGEWLVRETNPPLFYSLLKLWRWLVPADGETLRLLPLLLSVAQIGILSRWAAKTYGLPAALACIVLYAISPSDIYQSEYLRSYVLAKLALTISFIALVSALGDRPKGLREWAVYAGAAVVAIYSHTTMILWPAIATAAVLIEWAWHRKIGRGKIGRLIAAGAVILCLSAWELWTVALQAGSAVSNIAWIRPLALEDFWSSLNLQLLLGGTWSSAVMAVLMLIGAFRTSAELTTRLSATIVILGLLSFRVADLVQPITTDYTLHWCATFTVLLAGAAFADKSPRCDTVTVRLAALLILTPLAVDGLSELDDGGLIPAPQDWRYVLDTAAQSPNTALLVSHESIGVVVNQACRLRFHNPACPFPLVVMENPAPSDSWAKGGYPGPIVPTNAAPRAFGTARSVLVFSRYVYAPLSQLGLGAEHYAKVEWDDGELIGPIPVEAFNRARRSDAQDN